MMKAAAQEPLPFDIGAFRLFFSFTQNIFQHAVYAVHIVFKSLIDRYIRHERRLVAVGVAVEPMQGAGEFRAGIRQRIIIRPQKETRGLTGGRSHQRYIIDKLLQIRWEERCC